MNYHDDDDFDEDNGENDERVISMTMLMMIWIMFAVHLNSTGYLVG